jgi:ABC-type lipoprotein release transport system permease subunit
VSLALTLAARNLLRHRWRSGFAAGALVLAVSLLVATLAVIEGLFAEMVRGATGRYAGHVTVVPAGGADGGGLLPDPASLLERLRASPDVAAASGRLRVAALLSRGGRRQSAEVLGVEPRAEAALTDPGRTLVRGAGLAGPDAREVEIGAALAAQLGAAPGDELVLATRAADGLPAAATLAVAGIVTTGDPSRDARLAVVGLGVLRRLVGLPGAASEVGLALRDPEHAPAAAARLRAALPAAAGLEVLPWQRRLPALDDALRFARASSWWLVALFHAAAGLVVLNVMLVGAAERRREHAVGIALGAPPALLRRVVLLEALILGAAATAAGCALGSAAAAALARRGLPLAALTGPVGYAGATIPTLVHAAPRAADLLRAAAASLAVCALAGWIPGRALARMAPARVLADREAP